MRLVEPHWFILIFFLINEENAKIR
jgi:hypothetical protein